MKFHVEIISIKGIRMQNTIFTRKIISIEIHFINPTCALQEVFLSRLQTRSCHAPIANSERSVSWSQSPTKLPLEDESTNVEAKRREKFGYYYKSVVHETFV